MEGGRWKISVRPSLSALVFHEASEKTEPTRTFEIDFEQPKIVLGIFHACLHEFSIVLHIISKADENAAWVGVIKFSFCTDDGAANAVLAIVAMLFR